MSDLTPETLAELRRLYEVAFSVAAPENDWEEWTSKAAEAFPALLDAAAERDRLARLLDEPRRSGCAVEIAGVRIAPCDERGQTADMLAADRLRRELAYMAEARDNARAELRRLLDCSSKLPWECYRPHFASGYHSITASDGQTVAVEAGEYDAELIAAAINALPALLDAAAERDRLAATVKRVRALHEPYYPFRDGRACCGVCEGDEFDPYPCSTIRALDAETGGESCGSVSAWLLDIYRDGAAAGWDACLKSLRYEDGTPVEIVSFNNPYRTGEE